MKKYLKFIAILVLTILLCGCDLFGKSNPKVTIDYNCEGIEEYKCSTMDDKLNCIIIMPECKGYSFVGWYDAKASGNEVNLDSDFTKATTIYAVWEEDGSPKQTVVPPKEDTNPSKPADPPKEEEPAPVVVVEKTYKVTFNLNGGSGNTPQSVQVKNDEALPNIGSTIPTRNNYSFMGWYDNSDYTLGSRYYDESNEPVKYFDVKKNITLYAGWKENKVEVVTPPAEVVEKTYKVTFNLNGGNGTLPSVIDIKNKEKMPSIGSSIPTRSGYTFTGWYDNKDYTKGKMYYDETNQAVKYFDSKKDITLYAGWSKDLVVMSYKLIFNPNGGTGGQTDAVMVKKGESLPRITSTAPTKKGHTFLGWYDSLSGGTEYYNVNGVSNITYNKEENTTLYAHWKANTYSISFNINGGTGSTPTSANVTYGNMVPTIIKSTPSRSGYTFVGWYDNSDYTQGKAYYSSKNESVLKYDKTSNTTLYAGWSKNAVATYVVAFNSNGGTGGQTASVSVSKGSAMPSISKTAPVKDGYTFNGWYDQLTGGNQYYTKDGNSARNYDKSSGCTLYAQYTAITYKISYTLNGGNASNVTSAAYDKVLTINNPTKTFTVSIDSNSTGATLSSTSSSSTQTFLGWTADSNLDTKNALYGSTTSTNNRWTSRTTKVKDIYFKNLMSKSGTINLTANWSSVEVTLPTITKSGYTCGYSTSRTGSIAYASGSKYKPSITTNNAILYAVCGKTTYKVAFDSNGGSGGQTAAVYVAYGDAMPSISSKPTRDKYTFTGYYDAKEGGKQYYDANLKSATTYDKTKSITLYAGWKSNEKLKIYFLSIGRYDGYLIQGNGTTIFIDGGDVTPGHKAVLFLKEIGVTRIDALVGSHLHKNHIDAHMEMIENFEVGAVYYPDDPRDHKERKTSTNAVDVKKLNKMIAEKNIPINIMTPQLDYKIGNLTFDILGPFKLVADANANSAHMILKYGEHKFYFTGDSVKSVFNTAYDKFDHSVFENITIFKHPHHGQNEVPSKFIEVMKPKYVIVPNNTKSKAGDEFKKVGSTVYALNNYLDAKKIIGAGANLKGYMLAESDGKTFTLTDKRK